MIWGVGCCGGGRAAEPLCLAFPGGAWERGGWGWWVLRLGVEWIGEPDANAWRLIWGGLLVLVLGLRVVARRSRCVWRSQAEPGSEGGRLLCSPRNDRGVLVD